MGLQGMGLQGSSMGVLLSMGAHCGIVVSIDVLLFWYKRFNTCDTCLEEGNATQFHILDPARFHLQQTETSQGDRQSCFQI